jgi:hypothetical protein
MKSQASVRELQLLLKSQGSPRDRRFRLEVGGNPYLRTAIRAQSQPREHELAQARNMKLGTIKA